MLDVGRSDVRRSSVIHSERIYDNHSKPNGIPLVRDEKTMTTPTIQTRPLIPCDVDAIRNWPPYPREFEDLDYALRHNGWLTEYRNKPDTWCFAAEQSGELAAFTILSKTGEDEAEFRIALKAGKTGQGLGGAVTVMTLEQGFTELGLSRIHLIVRKNNPRAVRLYTRLGFSERGECYKNINGKKAQFLIMDVLKETYSQKGSKP